MPARNFKSMNERNIYERITGKAAIFLCIDALDFTPPRLKMRCCKYDASLPAGERITEEIDIYLPIGKFLVMAHDILQGVWSRKQRTSTQDGTSDAKAVYFEHYGGVYTPKVISRQLRVLNGLGNEASFAFVATAGPGTVSFNDLIVPAPGAKMQSIFINMPDQELKEMALIGKAYVEQYIGLLLAEKLQTIRQHRAEGGS